MKFGDFNDSTPRERAALKYTDSLVVSGHVDDATFAQLSEQFSAGEITEIGFALAAQNGPAKAFRGLVGKG